MLYQNNQISLQNNQTFAILQPPKNYHKKDFIQIQRLICIHVVKIYISQKHLVNKYAKKRKEQERLKIKIFI